nr:RNA-directed DNA polymerase, eukaryota [Tanacetum cinerariifolium]
MSKVLLMVSGETVQSPQPKYPGFYIGRRDNETYFSSKQKGEVVPLMLQDIVTHLQPMAKKQTAKSIFRKLLVAATSYHIWIERNNRLFRNAKRSSEELRDIIMVTVCLKIMTFRFKNISNVIRLLERWKMPKTFRLYGNFVLRRENDENAENYIWQSFDYPTDIFLPGMKLGWSRKTGNTWFITSWKNNTDPGSGDYSLKMDIEGFPELVIWKNDTKTSRSGPWTGKMFSGTPEMKGTNLSTCGEICRKSCSCAAYSNMDTSGGGSGCAMWEVDLMDMRHGYMSPEYAMDGSYSTKSDVFSFGVLVLEIVSGQKNRGSSYTSSQLSLLGYTWMLWEEGNPFDLLDESLGPNYSEDEVLRCIQIGLLCVQEQPEDRPSMSKVLWMLSSETSVCSVYGTVVDVFIPSKKSKADSYVSAVNKVSPSVHTGPRISPSPVLVLDDVCINERDFSNFAMGRVKDFNAIPNLQIILADEGFEDAKLFYLGGKWVMFEFVSKRLCIITKHPTSILESFKIIVKGRVFMVRAKELFTWNPSYLSNKEKEYMSDDDSARGENFKEMQPHLSEEEDGEFNTSDVEEVAETIFGDNSDSHVKHNEEMGEQHSDDPFEIYELLKQKKVDVETQDPSPSLSHPPGFTPVGSKGVNIRDHVFGEEVTNMDNEFSSRISAKVMNNSQVVQEAVSCKSVGQSEAKKGGSFLGVLEEVIRVGQAIWYSMEGCEKDVKSIIGKQGEEVVDSLGNSGGILCIWEETVFKKDHVTISDSFVAIYETWVLNKAKILIVAIYAPHDPKYRRVLWDYISILLSRWNGEGYTFTWSHPSANKMSKLDRFLVSDGVISLFPSITALCLDRHLSDHRPITLTEVKLDFGPVPFRLYHSWFSYVGFDDMVEQTWCSFSYSDSNGKIRFKKKLQELKKIMRLWIKDKNTQLSGSKQSISFELSDIDKELDQGEVSDSLLFRRHELKYQLNGIKVMEATDSMQKSKVRWAIEGDENSKYFHCIINKKQSQLEIRGVFHEGNWLTDPSLVKKAFLDHYESRFKKPTTAGLKHNFSFPVTRFVWLCGIVRKISLRVWMGSHLNFLGNTGSVSVTDAKFVNDYRPISLIGSVYKVVTKIMANRLALVIADIVSDSQSVFVANRQILDGPFILNEVLHWCKRKNKKVMFFKVDFAKAYDSVRWDFLIDVLEAFGFGPVWCNWIRCTFCFAKASILVNGSPSNEAVNEGLFKGIRLQGSLSLSHLFYADDALFIGEWSDANLRVEAMAVSIGCSIMQQKFCYLGVLAKTLSIGGRLTLLKSVLGASPLYTMSIFKVPKGVLKVMESIRNNFFKGAESSKRKISWVACDKILASRKKGGLGVLSYPALNGTLLLKWVWRFVSQDGSLWFRVIQSVHGSSLDSHLTHTASIWSSILKEGDKPFCDAFPRIFALELNCQVFVAEKLAAPLDISLRRSVREVLLWSHPLALFVSQVRKMSPMSYFGVLWLGRFYDAYVVGGFSLAELVLVFGVVFMVFFYSAFFQS